MFTIKAVSQFEELYRYNVLINCASYDSNQNELWVGGGELQWPEDYTPIQTSSDEWNHYLQPQWFKRGVPLQVECKDMVGDVAVAILRVILYVIPNTLPTNKIISEVPDFPITLTIWDGDEQLYEKCYDVNQWGGMTVDFNIDVRRK